MCRAPSEVQRQVRRGRPHRGCFPSTYLVLSCVTMNIQCIMSGWTLAPSAAPTATSTVERLVYCRWLCFFSVTKSIAVLRIIYELGTHYRTYVFFSVFLLSCFYIVPVVFSFASLCHVVDLPCSVRKNRLEFLCERRPSSPQGFGRAVAVDWGFVRS